MQQQTTTTGLTDKNFNCQVLENLHPFVVHFKANWSGSSDIMTCIMDDLARVYSGKITFGEIDADKHRQIALKFGITSIPTLLFFNKGKVNDQSIGIISKRELLDKLKALLHDTTQG